MFQPAWRGRMCRGRRGQPSPEGMPPLLLLGTMCAAPALPAQGWRPMVCGVPVAVPGASQAPTKWQRPGEAAPGLVRGQHGSRAPGEGSHTAGGQAGAGRRWGRRDPTALGTAYLEKPRAKAEQARAAALPGAGPSGADVPGPQPSSSEPRSSHERRLSSPRRTALGSPSASPAGEGEEPRSVFLSLFPLPGPSQR